MNNQDVESRNHIRDLLLKQINEEPRQYIAIQHFINFLRDHKNYKTLLTGWQNSPDDLDYIAYALSTKNVMELDVTRLEKIVQNDELKKEHSNLIKSIERTLKFIKFSKSPNTTLDESEVTFEKQYFDIKSSSTYSSFCQKSRIDDQTSQTIKDSFFKRPEFANLAGLKLTNKIIKSTPFHGCDLQGARWKNVSLSSTSFLRANLDNMKITNNQSNQILENIYFYHISARKSKFQNLRIQGTSVAFKSDFTESEFINCQFGQNHKMVFYSFKSVFYNGNFQNSSSSIQQYWHDDISNFESSHLKNFANNQEFVDSKFYCSTLENVTFSSQDKERIVGQPNLQYSRRNNFTVKTFDPNNPESNSIKNKKVESFLASTYPNASKHSTYTSLSKKKNGKKSSNPLFLAFEYALNKLYTGNKLADIQKWEHERTTFAGTVIENYKALILSDEIVDQDEANQIAQAFIQHYVKAGKTSFFHAGDASERYLNILAWASLNLAQKQTSNSLNQHLCLNAVFDSIEKAPDAPEDIKLLITLFHNLFANDASADSNESNNSPLNKETQTALHKLLAVQISKTSFAGHVPENIKINLNNVKVDAKTQQALTRLLKRDDVVKFEENRALYTNPRFQA